MSSTGTSTTVAAWTNTWQHLMLASVGLLALLVSGGIPGGTNVLVAAEGNIGMGNGSTITIGDVLQGRLPSSTTRKAGSSTIPAVLQKGITINGKKVFPFALSRAVRWTDV
ncbi:PilT protein-like protein [Anopheles sinensis]|uniref:PilT protein-like protein n=1 Tax=Anopheles sinensis TaxID=74873 RepID=A0A084W892_ANOSI|nr:PilT protein-like protein [Anopheles sinensis]